MAASDLFTRRTPIHGGHSVQEKNKKSSNPLKQDLCNYSVFHNKATGWITGDEIEQASATFKQRWLSFFQIKLSKLPHLDRYRDLLSQQQQLLYLQNKTDAPLLGATVICAAAGALIALLNLLVWLIIPAACWLLVWWRQDNDILDRQKALIHNQNEMAMLEEDTKRLAEQSNHFPYALTNDNLKELFTNRMVDRINKDLKQLFGHKGPAHPEQFCQIFCLNASAVLQLSGNANDNNKGFPELREHIASIGSASLASVPLEEGLNCARIQHIWLVYLTHDELILRSTHFDWISLELFGNQTLRQKRTDLAEVKIHRDLTLQNKELVEKLPQAALENYFTEPYQAIMLKFSDNQVWSLCFGARSTGSPLALDTNLPMAGNVNTSPEDFKVALTTVAKVPTVASEPNTCLDPF